MTWPVIMLVLIALYGFLFTPAGDLVIQVLSKRYRKRMLKRAGEDWGAPRDDHPEA